MLSQDLERFFAELIFPFKRLGSPLEQFMRLEDTEKATVFGQSVRMRFVRSGQVHQQMTFTSISLVALKIIFKFSSVTCVREGGIGQKLSKIALIYEQPQRRPIFCCYKEKFIMLCNVMLYVFIVCLFIATKLSR